MLPDLVVLLKDYVYPKHFLFYHGKKVLLYQQSQLLKRDNKNNLIQQQNVWFYQQNVWLLQQNFWLKQQKIHCCP